MGVPVWPSQAAGQTPNELGFDFLEAGNFEPAAEFFRQALEDHPDDPVVWNNLGCAYYRQGKYQDAKPCFQKAATLEPTFGRALLNLAATEFRQRDFLEAYKTYLLARKVDHRYVLSRIRSAQVNGKIDVYVQQLPVDRGKVEVLLTRELQPSTL